MPIDEETVAMLTGGEPYVRPKKTDSIGFEIIGITEDYRHLVCSNGFTIECGRNECFMQDMTINGKDYHLPIMKLLSSEFGRGWMIIKE